jgi:hypothetical protein
VCELVCHLDHHQQGTRHQGQRWNQQVCLGSYLVLWILVVRCVVWLMNLWWWWWLWYQVWFELVWFEYDRWWWWWWWNQVSLVCQLVCHLEHHQQKGTRHQGRRWSQQVCLGSYLVLRIRLMKWWWWWFLIEAFVVEYDQWKRRW